MHGRKPLWLAGACDFLTCYASTLLKLHMYLNAFMIQGWLNVVMIQAFHKIYY